MPLPGRSIPRHPLREARARALPATLLALALAACSSATAPQNGGGTPPPSLTHPEGSIAAVDTLPGTPYGVAISKGGVVLAAMIGSSILPPSRRPARSPPTAST